MIVWMRRNARGIKATLEGEAASALAAGSTMALVAMAFLAVLREGLETSVFLLAAFQNSTDTTAAGFGAVLGLLAAVAIGLGLYRGGVRINLSQVLPDHRRRSSSSSPPGCSPPPPTPPTRRAGSTACRARRSTSPGWSSRARSPARC